MSLQYSVGWPKCELTWVFFLTPWDLVMDGKQSWTTHTYWSLFKWGNSRRRRKWTATEMSHVSFLNCPWEQEWINMCVCVRVRVFRDVLLSTLGHDRTGCLEESPSPAQFQPLLLAFCVWKAGRVGLAELWGPPYIIRAWHMHWHTSGEWSFCHNTVPHKIKQTREREKGQREQRDNDTRRASGSR